MVGAADAAPAAETYADHLRYCASALKFRAHRSRAADYMRADIRELCTPCRICECFAASVYAYLSAHSSPQIVLVMCGLLALMSWCGS